MNSKHEADAARVSEMLFVDASIDDLATILGNLRPGVEAVVLDRAVPPARQIAVALHGVRGLDAVHVIAHGAPGRVSFAAGLWSVVPGCTCRTRRAGCPGLTLPCRYRVWPRRCDGTRSVLERGLRARGR